MAELDYEVYPHKFPGFVDLDCPHCPGFDLDWDPVMAYWCRNCRRCILTPRQPGIQASPEARQHWYAVQTRRLNPAPEGTT